MVKGSFLDDTFEKLVELGSSTAKKTGKAVAQTFSPLQITERLLGHENTGETSSQKNYEKKPQSHTPLNFEKLQQRYAEQDEIKQRMLRQRLFQMIKQQEEKVQQEKKQTEGQQKLMEERKKQEEERKRQLAQQQVQEEIPRGKIRRSIFSPKKVAQQKHAEIKPSIGKN